MSSKSIWPKISKPFFGPDLTWGQMPEAPKKTPKAVRRLQERKEIHKDLHIVWRLIWVTAGFLVLLAGLAMLVLPGPAILVIPVGLAILALEFSWAERLLERGVESGMSFGGKLRDTLRARRLLVGAAVVLFLLAGLSVAALLFTDWI
jgi:uncharacterized protein (TIGR02611 family)